MKKPAFKIIPEVLSPGLSDSLKEHAEHQEELTARLDKVLIHKYWGFPIMVVCFSLLFLASFTIGAPISELLGLMLDRFAELFQQSVFSYYLPPLLMSMIADGVFRGIGSALAFFPQMLLFFAFFTVITETGYADRIAFIMHRPMARLKMAGQTFTPLILGYSCNVSSIISARSIPNPLDRLIMMLISSFIPCSARFAVILYIAAAFFAPVTATLIMSVLVVLSWVVTALVSYLIKTRFTAEYQPPESLPLSCYRWPKLKNVLKATLYRTLDFLNRIKNVVIISSVLIWFLSSFPLNAPFEASFAARIGQVLEPIGELMGLNWRLLVALIFGFFAKETTLSTLGVLYHASEGLGDLGSILIQNITPLAGLTFLVVYMFYIPCVATLTCIYKESQSRLFTLATVVVSLLVGLLLGIVTYNLGSIIQLIW
ncbi:MAG: nucleoside recognition domain-containing protein [Bacillota bacterium]|jgi:ferrous iron transport protein B